MNFLFIIMSTLVIYYNKHNYSKYKFIKKKKNLYFIIPKIYYIYYYFTNIYPYIPPYIHIHIYMHKQLWIYTYIYIIYFLLLSMLSIYIFDKNK